MNAGVDVGYGKLTCHPHRDFEILDGHVRRTDDVIACCRERAVGGHVVVVLDADHLLRLTVHSLEVFGVLLERVVTTFADLDVAETHTDGLAYGMLLRLDVGADAFLIHLVIDDNLVGIAIQRHALSKLIFGRNDNLFATRELNRALGCTTVRVELAYGRLHHRASDLGPLSEDAAVEFVAQIQQRLVCVIGNIKLDDILV